MRFFRPRIVNFDYAPAPPGLLTKSKLSAFDAAKGVRYKVLLQLYQASMESHGSIANDLYSNILPSPSVGLGSKATTTQAGVNFHVSESDPGDLWYDKDFEESETMSSRCHTIGYRDGIIAGKEAALQEGFNTGFMDSVLDGYNWGLVRGVSSAMASLPDGIKEKLVEAEETRNKFQRLHSTVQSMSSAHALQVYHSDLKMKSLKPKGTAGPSSTETDQSKQSSGVGMLKSFDAMLQSILQESPLVEVHSKVN